MMKIKPTDELTFINDILREAHKYELTTEVIWSALKLLKKNNELSIMDALWIGRNEWIK